MNNEKWILAGVAALVLFQVLSFFNLGSSLGVGTPNIEDYDPFIKTYGINTAKDITTTGTITGVAQTLTGTLTGVAATLSGLFTANAGILHSYSLATSTGSNTIGLNDLNGYDTVIVTPTGAAGAKTLTFAASSSMSTWLPTAGDRQETCFLNASTSVATLVFAGGTGIDLQVATSTNGNGGAMDLTISPNGTGCFTFIRKAATASAFDIEANLLEYEDGD